MNEPETTRPMQKILDGKRPVSDAFYITAFDCERPPKLKFWHKIKFFKTQLEHYETINSYRYYRCMVPYDGPEVFVTGDYILYYDEQNKIRKKMVLDALNACTPRLAVVRYSFFFRELIPETRVIISGDETRGEWKALEDTRQELENI